LNIEQQKIYNALETRTNNNTVGTLIPRLVIENYIKDSGFTAETHFDCYLAHFLNENEDASQLGLKMTESDVEFMLVEMNKLSPANPKNNFEETQKPAIIEMKKPAIENNMVVKESLALVKSPESKKDLTEFFSDFFEKAEEWKAKADLIIVETVKDTKMMKEAGTGRKALVKVRTGAKTACTLKKQALASESKAISNILGEIDNIIKPLENSLKEKEEFKKRELDRLEKIEDQKKDLLAADRLKLIAGLPHSLSIENLRSMDEIIFESVLSGLKANKELQDKKEVEDKAAADLEAKQADKIVEIKTYTMSQKQFDGIDRGQGIKPEMKILSEESKLIEESFLPQDTTPNEFKEAIKEKPSTLNPLNDAVKMVFWAKGLKALKAPDITDPEALKMCAKVLIYIEAMADRIEYKYEG